MKRPLYNTISSSIIIFGLLFLFACSGSGDKEMIDPTPSISSEKERVEGVWPISGTTSPDELASAYGLRILSGSYDFHRGFDVRAPTGTSVFSILNGTVVRVETGAVGSSLERFGNFIVIAHEAIVGTTSHQTVYLHLDEFSVKEGEVVKMGDEIGKSGKSGVGINTEHLHFEYHIGANNGLLSRLRTRNPLRILPYQHIDYVIEVTKSFNTITIEIKLEDSSLDLVNINILPKNFNRKELNFETRIGINSDDEDVNPFQGLNIIPSQFIPTSDFYQLTLKLDGSWSDLNELSLELTDVRDSTRALSFSF